MWRYGWLLLFVLLIPCLAFAQTPATYRVGAAETDITPLVDQYDDLNGNGRFDMGDPQKPYGFGDRVTKFVEGDIFVGNGEGKARYIYDPISVYAMVIEDPETGRRIALVGADVYMVLHPDVESIRKMVDPKYGIDFIVIAATHNHMGPDTLGMMGLGGLEPKDFTRMLFVTGKGRNGINFVWFERFRHAIVRSIEEATKNLQPAHLTFARGEFNMGRVDMREPMIIDPSVNVIAADDLEGKPIATLVQWANHPEAVLMYGHPNRKGTPEYEALTDIQRDAYGRTITTGFPGYTRRTMTKLRGGGVSLYFNGPVGGLLSNIRAPLWDPEKHPEYPADTPPEKVPQNILVGENFTFATIQGRELAKAAYGALQKSGEKSATSRVSYAKKKVLLPMENNSFRLLGSIGALGFTPGKLYDDQGNVDNDTGGWIGGLYFPGLKVGKGKNSLDEVSVVNIGPAQIVNIPTETVNESVIGLPDDFVSNEDKYYPEHKKLHAHGENYRLSAPPLVDAATGKYLFVFNLSGGENGYAIPKADFDPPRDLKIPPFVWFWWICFDAENNPHYEESNSLTSELEPRLLGAAVELLQENPITDPTPKTAEASKQ